MNYDFASILSNNGAEKLHWKQMDDNGKYFSWPCDKKSNLKCSLFAF